MMGKMHTFLKSVVGGIDNYYDLKLTMPLATDFFFIRFIFPF